MHSLPLPQISRAVAVVAGVAGAVAAAPAVASADSTTQVFDTPGTTHSVMVPAGATSATIHAIGGAGGFGLFQGSLASAPGRAADVTGTLSVTPGRTLVVRVAGNAGVPGAGANGGGTGAVYTEPTMGFVLGGGGGGGFSDLANPAGKELVVAGGGGGGAAKVNGGDAATARDGSGAAGPGHDGADGDPNVDIGGGGGGYLGGAPDHGGSSYLVPRGTDWSASNTLAGPEVEITFYYAPRWTARPVVSAPHRRIGDTVTTTTGQWDIRPDSTTIGWERCDASVQHCTAIAGATGSSYTITADDAGSRVRSVVTGKNQWGRTEVVSRVSGVLGAPVLTRRPSLSGTAAVGSPLTVDDGGWSGLAPTFTYRWHRCPASGSPCTVIPGATGNAYTPTAGDAGLRLRAVVVAANAAGQASAKTGLTRIVADAQGSAAR